MYRTRSTQISDLPCIQNRRNPGLLCHLWNLVERPWGARRIPCLLASLVHHVAPCSPGHGNHLVHDCTSEGCRMSRHSCVSPLPRLAVDPWHEAISIGHRGRTGRDRIAVRTLNFKYAQAPFSREKLLLHQWHWQHFILRSLCTALKYVPKHTHTHKMQLTLKILFHLFYFEIKRKTKVSVLGTNHVKLNPSTPFRQTLILGVSIKSLTI